MVVAEKQLGNLDVEKEKLESNKNKIKAGMFVLGLSLLGGLTAGTYSARLAKKKSQQYYKDLNMEPKVMLESPTSLGLRALAWATFYSVGFFSLAIFGACKWFEISSLDDLRTKLRKYTRSKKPSEGRTEFENLSDFLRYLDETYSKPKEEKQQQQQQAEGKL